MPKWKPMTETNEELKSRLKHLKNREMRLEADLAIQAHPGLELIITKLAVATAATVLIEQKIEKMRSPTINAQNEVERLITRVNYHRGQLLVAEQQLKAKTGNSGNKQIELREHYNSELEQLIDLYKEFKQYINDSGVNIRDILPTTADHVVEI